MKKLSYLFFILSCLFVTTTFAQANMQTDQLKQKMMTELKIDNGKADSVLNIVHDFYANTRTIRGNSALKDDERKLAMQNSKKEEMARLRSQLSGDQIQKLQQIMAAQREERKGSKDSSSMQ